MILVNNHHSNHWQMWLPALLNLDITHCQMLIIQDTEHNMKESQRAYNEYRTQYRMLIAELVKRDKDGEPPKNNRPSTANNSQK